MGRTGIIFRKELTDILRDRRTIITMVIVPLLAMPLLLNLIFRVAQRQQRKATAETVDLAFVGGAAAPALYQRFANDSAFSVVDTVAEADIEEQIRSSALDGAVIVPDNFNTLVAADIQAGVQIYLRSSSSFNVAENRITRVIDDYDHDIVAERIDRLALDENLFDAIEIARQDVSTRQETLAKTIGGFLPYLLVLFMFTGASIPGIDLGAGEKERGTLETLLSSPATRLEIVLGKFLVITLAGLISAALSLLGLYIGLRNLGGAGDQGLSVIFEILSARSLVTMGTLLIPLAVFFAGIILAISIHAKSFKEAQSSLTPASIALIVPVAIGLLPGIEFTAKTALIPILNVSLATKEILAGTAAALPLTLTYLSLSVLAAASVVFSVRWFQREETLFRS